MQPLFWNLNVSKIIYYSILKRRFLAIQIYLKKQYLWTISTAKFVIYSKYLMGNIFMIVYDTIASSWQNWNEYKSKFWNCRTIIFIGCLIKLIYLILFSSLTKYNLRKYLQRLPVFAKFWQIFVNTVLPCE